MFYAYSLQVWVSYLLILKRFDDFIIFFLGCLSFREKDIGSWFVYAIALAFMKHARNNHLKKLYDRVPKPKFKIKYFYIKFFNEFSFC